MRDTLERWMATPAILAVVLAMLGATAVLWPPLAQATDVVTDTTGEEPLGVRTPTVPELDDVLQDPVGTIEETVEDPASLLEPDPEPTAEPAADEPRDESQPTEPEEEPERAPQRPEGASGGTAEPNPDDVSAVSVEGAPDKPANEGPSQPVRRPLLDSLPDDAAKEPQTPALAPFQMGLLNDGAVPDEGYPELLLAPQPGYWLYDARPGPRSTGDIFGLLGNVVLLPTQIARLLAPFPVAGPANYSDDWGAPRHVPSFHPHAGTDIFAEHGTPVIASFDGVISRIGRATAIGGNSLRLVLPDGTFLYYAHLAGFARGIDEGVSVRQGDVIGFVGDSGNAKGTPPHLHFEIHPGGGGPTPPVPFLDRWLADARAAVQQYANMAVTPLAPIVAPPAGDTSTNATDVQLAPTTSPIDPPGTEVALRDLEGTAAATDTASPLAVFILLGAAALFFLMLRGSRRPKLGSATDLPGPAPEPAWLGPFVPLPLGEEKDLAVVGKASASISTSSGRARRPTAAFEPLPLDSVAIPHAGDASRAS